VYFASFGKKIMIFELLEYKFRDKQLRLEMKAGEEIKKRNLFLGLILIVITIVLFHDWVQKMVELN
jgi:hypothetical protein